MSTTLLSIDQLLRAAQLLEHNSLVNKLVVANGSGMDNGASTLLNFGGGGAFAQHQHSFGEDYKERILATKMALNTENAKARYNPTFIYTSNSTGSSRRSSPLSVPSSSPNSPVSFLASVSPHLYTQQNLNQSQSQVISSTPPMLSTSSSNGGSNGITLAEIQAIGMPVSAGEEPIPQTTHKISTSSRQSRAAHNELEKNRRANLRNFLDTLKAVLPNDPECSRDTTLSLLTRARNHIRVARERQAALLERREALLREHVQLREQLKNCTGTVDALGAPESSIQKKPLPAFSVPASSSVMEKKQQQPKEAFRAVVSKPSCSTVEKCEQRPMDAQTLYAMGLLQALPLIFPYSNNKSSSSRTAKSLYSSSS